MSTSIYSFGDVTLTLSHPSLGQYVAGGEGLGSISTSMATDRTTHDVSADGSVMVSKIKGRNGSHAIAIQQTSPLNQWLLKAYNYLENAPANEWAKLSIVQRAPSMHDLITSTGVSFQKLPDKPYQAQGQQVTWNFMAADIQQDVI
ncbi:DUF3277 family protein [Paenibacillus sp. LMG 31456]|uniref:DUF3277 family protein n=1 Tax=Paenibacillus foliorum TaxID=2654974 RepID=A0A972GRL9_9BACL|nr:phage protein [Paenibacillus foliorum]NOU95591.1 DUF3277 family protein [Paenibacillus foliorum]